MTMKRTFLLGVAMLCTQLSFGQFSYYIPASEPEYNYSTISPSSCTLNDVGTDTRDASGGSDYYANFLNVTVNSCRDATLLTPTFNWESSHGTSGILPLPADAYDPDVVLVSPDGSDETWAIAVYYSQDYGGYCMSVSEFEPGPIWEFTSISGPMLIQNYTPYSNYEPHINIDSDDEGHYAVVMQMNGYILSKTRTYVGGMPLVPVYSYSETGLIEPDVAYIGNGGDRINIVALTESRNRYRVVTRNYAGGWEDTYNSPVMPYLFQPRIAAPVTGTEDEYAVTVGQQYTGGGSSFYDILVQVNEGPVYIANDGTWSLPVVNANNRNVLPCLTYTYNGYSTGEKLSVGWYIESIGINPMQPNTFIGLDLTIGGGGTLTSTTTLYQDVSNFYGYNNESTLALSGRHTVWAKTAAFTYANSTSPSYAAQLKWKYVYAGTPHWKPTDVDAVANENTGVAVYPNPATNEINISVNAAQPYSYEIYNQLGQIVEQGAINGSNKTVTIANWANGLYIVKIENQETQEVSTVQFVKQ